MAAGGIAVSQHAYTHASDASGLSTFYLRSLAICLLLINPHSRLLLAEIRKCWDILVEMTNSICVWSIRLECCVKWNWGSRDRMAVQKWLQLQMTQTWLMKEKLTSKDLFLL